LQVIEDLEALFNAFDDDHSGELDEEEVGLLVSQMGTKLSQEENHNLFRIMDADGGGTVSFREFATVVLHQKNSSRSVPFTCPQIYGIPMPMSRMPQALLVQLEGEVEAKAVFMHIVIWLTAAPTAISQWQFEF